jgi:streptogramin lyase
VAARQVDLRLVLDVAGDGRRDRVRVVAGACGTEGPAGAEVASEDARFSSPVSVAVGPDGAVWVADRNNHVVRRWCP